MSQKVVTAADSLEFLRRIARLIKDGLHVTIRPAGKPSDDIARLVEAGLTPVEAASALLEFHLSSGSMTPDQRQMLAFEFGAALVASGDDEAAMVAELVARFGVRRATDQTITSVVERVLGRHS